MSGFEDIPARLLALLFPPYCIACGQVDGFRSRPLCLCRRCASRVRPADEARCIWCGERVLTAGSKGIFRCQHCPIAGSPARQQLALWRYEPPIASVIQGLKSKRMEFLGSQLAATLHQKFYVELSEINVVVPMPLYWYRRFSRGFNQAEAIARPLAELLGVNVMSALRRRRPTRAQKELGRAARLKNLQSVVAVTRQGSRSLAGKSVLLVDDVLTTGSTLGAAAETLAAAGVHSVTPLTVAATPLKIKADSAQIVANVEDRRFRGF